MPTTVYPVLCVDDVAASAGFYLRHFGFEQSFGSDWYVSLRHPDGGAELAILDAGHETIPEGYRRTAASGALINTVLINIEVDDVDAVHARLADQGVDIVQELRSEGFGQRHFIARDPAGVLVDVITPIEPSAEFTAQFA